MVIQFQNELGNTITMGVGVNGGGVHVVAVGPNSLVEHTWTVEEAKQLRDLLSSELGALDNGSI